MSPARTRAAAKVAANTHATGRDKLTAHLAMLLFAVLIAGSFSFGGIATRYASPSAVNILRYMLTVAVMAAGMKFILGKSLTLPKAPWRFLLLGGLMAIYMFTMFKALEITSPVSTGAVFTLMPLISAGFAWLFVRQRTRLDVLGSLVLAAIGAIWVIFHGDLQAILSFDIGKGEVIFFVGVICHAAYAPLIRILNRGEDGFTFGFWAVTSTGLWLLLPGIPAVMATDLPALPAIVWVAILYLAVITTAFTFLLLQYAAMRLPSSKVLAYGYLTPTFIIIAEGVIGHGWATLAVFAGALVTACGLVIMALLPD